jgi:type IV pilus assembly protein PilV
MMEEHARMQHDGQAERGFSLIEVLIAITVITVGLVSVAAMSIYVSRTNSTSQILGILATTVQDEADKLRLLEWDLIGEDPRLSVGGNIDYYSSDDSHRTTVSDTPAGDINVSWVVAAGPGTIGDMRTITIRVTQVGAPSRLADGITISTIICKN